jgi:hypothetical protein
MFGLLSAFDFIHSQAIYMCWIKNVILEKTEVLFAMENNLYL